ncbi:MULTISPECIES: VC0807 family protein [Streptomyces]|uniref:Membrane protein n=1 Tax=Streptomyces viridochromogenes TaxID=1938 RepID=A0A0L8JW59_STRVR|nr:MULTISPECIES: VC0807 family protein [Streptomyces]KOG17883.1 membrane protein [Streptomyces viridochromogenes]
MSAPARPPAEATAPPEPPARSGAASALGWILTIGLNVVAPILTYDILTEDHGWSEFSALLLSSAWPVLDTAIVVAWRRKVDEFAVVTLVFLVITAVVSLVGAHTARALLVKDSCVTGLFGLLCLATLLAPRPLMFYFGRKFATDGTPASTAWWNGLWQYEGFRSTMRTMTLVWGVAYVAEALVRVALAYALPTKTMVALSPVMIYSVLAALGVWTAWFGKRRAAEGARRQAEADAAAAAATA